MAFPPTPINMGSLDMVVVVLHFPNVDPHAWCLTWAGAGTLVGGNHYAILSPHTGFSYGGFSFHIMVTI